MITVEPVQTPWRNEVDEGEEAAELGLEEEEAQQQPPLRPVFHWSAQFAASGGLKQQLWRWL